MSSIVPESGAVDASSNDELSPAQQAAEAINSSSNTGVELGQEAADQLVHDQTVDELDASSQTLAQQLAENEQVLFENARKFQDEIEEEVRRTQPLVSRKECIDSLVCEYDPEKSQEYFGKAMDLAEYYTNIRRIRGDGNCFYRAMLVGQLERCLTNSDELKRFTAVAKGWRQKLLNLGMPELTTSDFCDMMDQTLDGLAKNTIRPSMLFDNMNDENVANYNLMFFRLIASGYLRENKDLYTGFIEGGRSLDQYCQEDIESMWTDSDHLSINALVKAMQVPIRIEYMDRTQAPDGGWHHDFLVEGQGEPKICFLYRPGHYDILYPKAEPQPGQLYMN